MISYSTAIDIAAPPQRVWSVMTDGERWPEWTRSVTSVTLLDRGPLDVGTRVKIRQPKFPPTVWRITQVDPGRSFTWAAIGPGSRVHARHVVEPMGSGARATLSVEYEGMIALLVARLTRATNERYLKMEAEGLKARSENPQWSVS